MDKKLLVCDRYGVAAYYIYDPDRNNLRGWLRSEDGLDVIPQMADWVSPACSFLGAIGGSHGCSR